MIIWTSLANLQAGQQVQLAPGDTLRIVVEIKAIMPKLVNTELWASLIVEPGRDYTVKRPITLAQSATEKTYTEVMDMLIPGSGLENRAYDLWVELPAFNEVVKIQSAVLISGIGAGALDLLSSMLPMLMMLMMLGMVMPMMQGFGGEE